MRVLYAGSFDPFHEGHLGVVTAAAGRFDEVVVAVVANPDKPQRTPLVDRAEAIRLQVAQLPNVRVVWHEGLTTDLARSLGVHALVRGATRDHANELAMAHLNRQLGDIPTLFIPASAETRHISSTARRAGDAPTVG